MVAPVAVTITKKLGISSVKSVIAISVASNLLDIATLVGDTAFMLLGAYANMNFLNFFVYQGKPGLFWIVQLGAIASTLVLLYILRDENQRIMSLAKTPVSDYFPSYLLVSMIILLIIASFIPNTPQMVLFLCFYFLLAL